MDYMKSILLISFLYAIIHIIFSSLSRKNTKSPKLPPGPPCYPLIGNILQLDTSNLPQSLSKLSQKYGPIMTVKVGTITTFVISSPTLAKETLHKNGPALNTRYTPDSVKALSHEEASVLYMPVSPKWNAFRKVCGTKIFSSQNLDSSQSLRGEKLKELIVHLRENCREGKGVDIGDATFTTVLNSMSNTFFSVDLAHYCSDSSKKFRDVISSVLVETSKPNIADYGSIFSRFDPQGARRRMKSYYQVLLADFESIIEKRLQKKDPIEGGDVLDSLLDFTRKENSELTCNDLLHLFLDLFVAGLDSTSTTVEWAMAGLLQNPEKLKKTRKELQQVLSKDGELKDSDINKLPYLQALVKETLRLHPPGPLLAYKSVAEVDICGFRVPRDATVLVNVWGMGHDSSIWTDPNLFLPERFLEGEDSFREDIGFNPFGAGRRMCPGVPFAHRVVHTILATLLYHFDWRLADGQKSEAMDMTEKFMVTLSKGKPLMAIPVKEQ